MSLTGFSRSWEGALRQLERPVPLLGSALGDHGKACACSATTGRSPRRLASRIRVRGHLGPAMLRAFPALHAETLGRDTLLRGVADQAVLYGVLARIEELGLELLEVRACPGRLAGAASSSG